MPQSLSYGNGRSLSLRFPSGTPIVQCSNPVPDIQTDAKTATETALDKPLDFPPLAAASVPGDQITVAVCASLPCMQPIAIKVIDMLLDATAKPEEITLLLPNASDVARYKSQESIHSEIHLESHTADDREALGYLAASQQGNPVYFHRSLCDADLVIPIESSIPDIDGHNWTLQGKLFPTFSDAETKSRILVTSDSETAAQHVEESREAAWLLGIQLGVQVIPGPRNEVLHVLAGQSETIQRIGSDLSTRTWRSNISSPAGLVIGTIEGGPELQTWEHVARALAASATVVQEGGAIALCTELKDPPSPALKRMAYEAIDPSIQEERSGHFAEDELIAQRIRQTLNRASIYLVSELESQVIESIGITHVEKPESLQRLGEQCDSCILVNNAQYATPVLSQQ